MGTVVGNATMLPVTIGVSPGSKVRSKPPPTLHQAIERATCYRARLTIAENAIAKQREQLVDLRKQVGELSDVEKQLESERIKRINTEKLLFSERKRKRTRSDDGHNQEAQNDNGLRGRLLKVLRIVHPDRADPGLKLGPHEISAAINDLIAGGTGEAVFGCKAQSPR
jgi:hypothetical protein